MRFIRATLDTAAEFLFAVAFLVLTAVVIHGYAVKVSCGESCCGPKVCEAKSCCVCHSDVKPAVKVSPSCRCGKDCTCCPKCGETCQPCPKKCAKDCPGCHPKTRSDPNPNHHNPHPAQDPRVQP